MDLIDDPMPGQNLPEYSVSEIAGAVKRSLEEQFGRVRVRGEVGRVFKARSGHLYYDIKDDRNVLACTTWKGQVGSLSVVPEEGLEVVVSGRLSAFGAQSKYNLNVDEVAIAGQGALMALLQKRKAAFEAEGLFAAERKRPIPYLPEVIGVVTSPQGAVIRDILHRLRDRFPRHVLVWPVAVQGAPCAPEVANAINGFNTLTPGGALPRPDLLIVARGGGSVEDLWGFNEEVVVRAAAASQIPIISAVGHETDTTLIDYVSDKRAPTPTAAAELAVPVRHELAAWLDQQGTRLRAALTQGVVRRRQRLTDLGRALPRPESLTETPRQRFDLLADRLAPALMAGVQRRKVSLADAAGTLRPSLLTRSLQTEGRRLAALAARLQPALQRTMQARAERSAALGARLDPKVAQRQLMQERRILQDLTARLTTHARSRLDQLTNRLAAMDRLRETLGYKATLSRGYAVVRGQGQIVTTKAAAAKATALEIEFADGRLKLGGGPAPRKTKSDKPDQGSLFD